MRRAREYTHGPTNTRKHGQMALWKKIYFGAALISAIFLIVTLF